VSISGPCSDYSKTRTITIQSLLWLNIRLQPPTQTTRSHNNHRRNYWPCNHDCIYTEK